MHKKLLVAAVSSALGAMAAPVAFAQNATVQVYGTLYGEWSQISHGSRTPGANSAVAGVGDPYQNYNQFQNPGSELGIRGEEKLGGGLSAWFQCATTMDYRGSNNNSLTGGQSANAFCSRDSALGLKGGFGNILFGNWGTPFKRATNDLTGGNDTGVFGVSRILYGTSTTTGISPPAGNIANYSVSAASGLIVNTVLQTPVQPGVWRRRQSNLVAFDTPTMGGFTGMAAMTVGNNASGATSAQLKARLWSLGAAYANGPLALNVAYEKHDNFYATNSATAGGTIAANGALVAATAGIIPGGGACGNLITPAAAITQSATVPTQAISGAPTGALTQNATGSTASTPAVVGPPAVALAGGTIAPSTTTNVANSCNGSSENAWVMTGTYTFSNNLKLGAHYSRQSADTAVGAAALTQKVTTWMIGMDWMISGPHGIRVNYARAGDVKGTGPLSGGPLNGVAGSNGQAIGTATNVARPVANTGGGTGVLMWQIRYVHQLSKRTEFNVGYSRIDNKANANYEMGGASTTVQPGSDSHAVAMSLQHKF